jgi:YesN/AraC family two-component response regulator
MFYSLFERIQHSVARHKRQKTRRIVDGVAEVIGTHAFEPTFGAPEIAEALGMSAAYLGRVYKQATGRSIPEAVNEVRMRRARELLLETSKTVGEIAEAVGYANTPYFYRQFRLRHGVTPVEFRRHSRMESAHAL